MISPRWRPFLAAALIVAADRASKSLVEAEVDFWEQIPVIPGFFQIVHTRNTGIAFGMLQSDGGESSMLLIIFALVVMAFIGALLWNASKDLAREHWTMRYGLGLVMGGAIGNLYDRIVLGSVIDFLDFYWGSAHFPSFNVADSAITIGAALLLLNLWTEKHHRKAQAA